jgi:hypothetical protein
LKIIQLYQQFLSSAVVDGQRRPEHQIAFDIQNFATSLFQWADINCPSLKVLIWGMNGGIDDFIQYFFVKRVTYDQDVVRQITAPITTRNQLRDEFPELDLLEWGPGFDELSRQTLLI